MGNTCFAMKFFCLCFDTARGESSVPLTDEENERLEYFSPRLAAMMQSRDQFSSDIDHEIEFSKSHWSEVTQPTSVSEEDDEEMDKQNRELFLKLSNDPQFIHPKYGRFFLYFPWLKLGRKIAEGGQAEIFESMFQDGTLNDLMLFKVFKRGSLSQLQQQWPDGVIENEVLGLHCIGRGTMLEDGRFAFVMLKCWGDLRKLIDQAMIAKNNYGPPFPFELEGKIVHAYSIMRNIAHFMKELHAKGILHRDLKAANVLRTKYPGQFNVVIGDFECSIGVVGTTFWRAPEILLALRNGDPIIFTEKADVYSYGMTCFEIVVGRMPFEGELGPCRVSYDLVIEGQRPKLPSSLDINVKDLITSCWDPNPQLRPTFSDISRIYWGL